MIILINNGMLLVEKQVKKPFLNTNNRHTFAKQWIINGGSVVTLSKILGHSNIGITDKYINMLVDDIKKNVDEVDILSKFSKETKKIQKLKKSAKCNGIKIFLTTSKPPIFNVLKVR